MSEINTPASSTSVTATEEKNAPTLAEVVRKYKTSELINFLRKEEDLKLRETAIKILEKEEVNGHDFLKIVQARFSRLWYEGWTCIEACELCQGV